MFEVLLIIAISGLTTSFWHVKGSNDKPKAIAAPKRQWELTDEAKVEKKRRDKQRECRAFLFFIPTLLCLVPLVGGGAAASSQCVVEPHQCTQELYRVEVNHFSDQYVTALYNPGKVAQGIQPNLKIVFWVGIVFVYLQVLVWLIAARTLISLWVHDDRLPAEK